MNSSKTIFIIAAIALIMLFVFPIQSISINDDSVQFPTRHKRWTFNTWRLHGRRQLSNDFYSPKPSNGEYHSHIFNDDDDLARKIHERLSQLLNHQ